MIIERIHLHCLCPLTVKVMLELEVLHKCEKRRKREEKNNKQSDRIENFKIKKG